MDSLVAVLKGGLVAMDSALCGVAGVNHARNRVEEEKQIESCTLLCAAYSIPGPSTADNTSGISAPDLNGGYAEDNTTIILG